MRYDFSFSRLLLYLSVTASLLGPFPAFASSSFVPGQPGVKALSAMNESPLTDDEVRVLVESMKDDKQFKRMLQKLKDEEISAAAQLLTTLQKGSSLYEATTTLIGRYPEQARQFVRAAMLLFPIDRYPLYHQLLQASLLSDSQVKSWSSSTGVLTTPLYPAEAFDEAGVNIEPLIESLSITITGQDAQTTASISYRQADGSDNTWQQARDLHWEPVTGNLTGPVVYLRPDTTYTVRIDLDRADAPRQILKRQVTTRASAPPIDPQKVYQLADIYSGGTLDIEALDIQGKPGAWAKIVGNPELPITAEAGEKHAIDMGNNSYIYFENITVRGGRTHSVYAEKAHHIWINQCDIAGWGRAPNIMKDGIAYELEDAQPINYDSAIYLRRSGVITIENCHVHDPRAKANDWRFGHPKGPNAFFAHANHPDPAFKGQVILRNNRFEGSPEHRFNDVIEGRKNAEPLGGFVRDSAIYNNTLRYANDDGIEIDGGQYNVMVYNNDIGHSYTGVSAIPTRVGPAYIFNNYIHDLGDQTGKQWAAIKLGGLYTGSFGKTHVFHNLITVGRNGIAASRFQDDDSFYTHAQNNIVITQKDANKVGLAIFDPEQFAETRYINNFLFNTKKGEPKLEGTITVPYAYPSEVNTRHAQKWLDTDGQALFPIDDIHAIPNFTLTGADHDGWLNGVIK
ncbi:right-handed parallel beta-helix repeat-containing protein [Salinimonas chungwhensis]|uniref:right-handed parallel beta-helix repeat-containing protein n=1 Tax=Salinimonas chungwhensis TaxID=265425 RepID=UPI000375BFC3|nr:right-handed parallel beta-helix repeat-containing protein [Salinimonas chungwhensis]